MYRTSGTASSTVVTSPSRVFVDSPVTYVGPSAGGDHKGSRDVTTGSATKLYGGGGERVLHSSVGAPHGLSPAGLPLYRLRTTSITNKNMLRSMMTAPIVDTRLSVPQPVSSAYV